MTGERSRRSSGKRRLRRAMPPWLGFALTTALALLIAAFAGTSRSYFVPSDSMLPTLARDDQFRADILFSPGSGPRRGELWVLNNPRPDDGNGSTLVKRVVALPGDEVGAGRGSLWINGEPLKEPYLADLMSYSQKPRKLGPGEYWVLGDNRNESEDSHKWGPVTRSQFIGKVFVRYWPLRRFRWF